MRNSFILCLLKILMCIISTSVFDKSVQLLDISSVTTKTFLTLYKHPRQVKVDFKTKIL